MPLPPISQALMYGPKRFAISQPTIAYVQVNCPQDVTKQMQSSLSMSQQSVERIQQARDSFEQIRASVDEIRDQNNQIATAAEEQHQVAEDINRHIAQIHTDAQLVEELAHSARSDSQRLEILSGELNGLVRRFRT